MSDSLEPLLEALKLSPDNTVLRAHVVKEFIKARKYSQLSDLASPLLDTPERPLGLLGLARYEQSRGQIEKASKYYSEAIELDSNLIDEGLEADLTPNTALKVTTTGDLLGSLDMPEPESKKPGIGFDDLGGMEAVKEQIRMNIIYPMQKPEIYEAYGKKIGGGILLYGPPGCGKTHLARATAGELGANFFSLALNEILDMYIGNSEKNLAQLFETARAKAPSVLFIDEIDAMGVKRGSVQSASIRMMVTQFLTEMDGISSNNDKLLILGATNEPWSVDSALRRPGRFDRIIFVPPPDKEARAEILKIQARTRNADPSISWDGLAAKTEFFSGADLAQLVDQATERAVSDALRSGEMRPVNQSDFQAALRDRKPSTMDWLRRSKNYVNFSNQDGHYDKLDEYLKKVKLK